MSVSVYIGLGSNLDEPKQHVKTAIVELNNIQQSRLIKDSGLFKSPPMGPADQDDYINAVALIETELSAENLLDELQVLENKHGRVRKRHWGERTLDLDILLYGDAVIQTERLSIPHIGIAEREFVLYPLEKLDAELVLPNQQSLKQLINDCPVVGIEFLGKA